MTIYLSLLFFDWVFELWTLQRSPAETRSENKSTVKGLTPRISVRDRGSGSWAPDSN